MLDTNIGDDGVKAIAVALETNTTLTSIHLHSTELIGVLFVDLLWQCCVDTEIGDDGTKAVAKALESNTTLASIDLGGKRSNVAWVISRWLMHVSRQ
jgi:hypothetical protein